MSKYKHRNCIIEGVGTELHPDMVKITKTPALRKEFLDRRYITLEKCYIALETFESDRLIKSKDEYIKKALKEVVVLEGEGFSLLKTTKKE